MAAGGLVFIVLLKVFRHSTSFIHRPTQMRPTLLRHLHQRALVIVPGTVIVSWRCVCLFFLTSLFSLSLCLCLISSDSDDDDDGNEEAELLKVFEWFSTLKNLLLIRPIKNQELEKIKRERAEEQQRKLAAQREEEEMQKRQAALHR